MIQPARYVEAQSLAPDATVVYHVTTPDRAEKILTQGLIPYKTSECSSWAQQIDQKLDDHRPPHVVELGVRRLGSAYAHPDRDDAIMRNNGGWLRRASELVMLAVTVDPEKVYVCDGLLVMERHTPTEFWASIKTLQAYREEEEPVYEAPHPGEPHHWEKFIYMWPEVLLPGGAPSSAIAPVD